MVADGEPGRSSTSSQRTRGNGVSEHGELTLRTSGLEDPLVKHVVFRCTPLGTLFRESWWQPAQNACEVFQSNIQEELGVTFSQGPCGGHRLHDL